MGLELTPNLNKTIEKIINVEKNDTNNENITGKNIFYLAKDNSDKMTIIASPPITTERAKKVKEKEEKEYIIKDNTIKESSNDLRKKGYSLILEAQEIEEKIEQIPGTRLDVELGSLSKNSIILNYLSNNEEYGVYLKLNYYILEKKIGDKWHKVEPIRNELNENTDYRGDTFKLEKGKVYQVYKDFKEYTKNGLPKGKYRVVFLTYRIPPKFNETKKDKKCIMTEFEIK